MKDIVITGKHIRRELWVLLCCFVAAVCVNVYAIIKFDRPWIELVSMIGYEIVVAAVLYVLSWVVRFIIWIIKLIINKLK